MEGWTGTEGQKDGQTLFYTTFLVTTGGSTNIKIVKDTEYNVSLPKNYCITTSILTISSIHEFIIKIQQTLVSCELNGHTNFSPCSPKIIEITFSSFEFAPVWSLFHLLILEIQSALESREKISHVHFCPCPLKNFLTEFQWIWICINAQKNQATSLIFSVGMID